MTTLRKMGECRRCTECPDSEHHWLEDGYGLSCKHCEAIADCCLECVCDPYEGCVVCRGEVAHNVRPGPRGGVCAECGCTDDFGCSEGCSWVNAEHTLCSSCAEGTAARALGDQRERLT